MIFVRGHTLARAVPGGANPYTSVALRADAATRPVPAAKIDSIVKGDLHTVRGYRPAADKRFRLLNAPSGRAHGGLARAWKVSIPGRRAPVAGETGCVRKMLQSWSCAVSIGRGAAASAAPEALYGGARTEFASGVAPCGKASRPEQEACVKTLHRVHECGFWPGTGRSQRVT